jgi:hypothetical protein
VSRIGLTVADYFTAKPFDVAALGAIDGTPR